MGYVPIVVDIGNVKPYLHYHADDKEEAAKPEIFKGSKPSAGPSRRNRRR